MADWSVIAHFDYVHEASESISILEAAGIVSVLQGSHNSTFMKPYDLVGSSVKLMVSQEDCNEAIQILMDMGVLHNDDLGPDKLKTGVSSMLKDIGANRVMKIAEKVMYGIFTILIVLLIFSLLFWRGGGKF